MEKVGITILISNNYTERAMSREERRHWNRMPMLVLLQKMEAGDLPVVLRDGRIWGYEMDLRELEKAHGQAWSFSELIPPNNARYIGYRMYPTGKYLYWKDAAGNYWYDTEGGMAFKRQMEEIRKKKKMASGRLRMPG